MKLSLPDFSGAHAERLQERGNWQKYQNWVPQFRSFTGIHDYLSLGSMDNSEILFNMICNNKATSQRILAFSSILAHRYDWIKYLRFCMRKLYHAFLDVSHKSQFGKNEFLKFIKYVYFDYRNSTFTFLEAKNNI